MTMTKWLHVPLQSILLCFYWARLFCHPTQPAIPDPPRAPHKQSSIHSFHWTSPEGCCGACLCERLRLLLFLFYFVFFMNSWTERSQSRSESGYISLIHISYFYIHFVFVSMIFFSHLVHSFVSWTHKYIYISFIAIVLCLSLLPFSFFCCTCALCTLTYARFHALSFSISTSLQHNTGKNDSKNCLVESCAERERERKRMSVSMCIVCILSSS